MKYFTEEWCFSKLDDENIAKISEEYKIYINEIYKKLPYSLKLLAKNINLHDGLINEVLFHKDRSLIIKGIFGDLENGYFFLDIKYFISKNIDDGVIISTFKNKELEILKDEIELVGNNYIHRIFFASKKEFEIIFRDVEIFIKNASPDDYKFENCKLTILNQKID